MRGLLEVAALDGDTSAAREWLQHQRWRTEMRRGKPGASKINTRGTIVMIDNIGSRIAEARAGSQQEADTGTGSADTPCAAIESKSGR